MSSKRRQLAQQGQALLEFALIITVLLMMIFLIIESARILWAWNTVQNAAREGARYAITGQFNDPCDSAVTPKFADFCDSTEQDGRRVASIINATHTGLSGLPLDEITGTFEDDNYYQIEVYGVNQENQFLPGYGGMPNKPVIVRAYYRVPIITPLLQPIVPSVPVFGQVTMTNESFGQLGGSNQGEGVPPELPLIPTVGVTPSPTPTDTPGPTATPTDTPTVTPSPTPDHCGVAFDSPPIANDDFVDITGEIGFTVQIIHQESGATIGTGVLLDRGGHACPGYARITLSQLLVEDDLLVATSIEEHDVDDTAFVLAAPPTETPTFTPSPAPTATPSHTPTASPSPTPGNPYIVLLPNCGSEPTVQFTVQGFNWPINETINLYWDSDQLQSTINTGAATFFSQNWTINGVVNGTDYEVVAVSAANETANATFSVPCPVPPTATPITATPTHTPEPADLIIVGPPELISAPPIVAYEPVDFRVVISNTGGIDVESQFFVDIYLDPTTVLTTTIPITQSGGYQGIGSLAGGSSRVITITAPLGFGNTPEDHLVYGMVDSIEQINEDIETNNISTPFPFSDVIPADTPTPTPMPELGDDNIIGVVYYPTNKGLSPLLRADVTLVNADTAEVVRTTTTDPFTGFYVFTDLVIGDPPINYNVLACGSLITDEGVIEYFGLRTGITLPYSFPVNIYTDSSVPCP